MRTLLIVLALLLLAASPALAEKKETAEYDGTLHYKGIYKPARLYQLDERSQIWYAAKRPVLWEKMLCDKARSILRTKGKWRGNLSDAGACLGDAEAPLWATGNYLNYLTTKDD